MAERGDVIRRLMTEVWTGRNIDLVDEFVAEDYFEHAPFGNVEGRDGYREGIQLFVGAFSPVELELHEVIEAGDRVTARFTFRGHHGAEFLGVPPSNADVSVDGITMTRFEGGKVAEEWLCTDWYGLLQQIGAVPADFAGT